MRVLAAVVGMAFVASVASIDGARAQSDSKQQNDGASSSFQKAGSQLKDGAQRFGEGVKNGAIGVWDAVKSGAQTVGQKLQGQPAGKSQGGGPSGAGDPH